MSSPFPGLTDLAKAAAAAQGPNAPDPAGGRQPKKKVPVEQLDYSFVRECKDETELAKVILTLRSGAEGSYPDLLRFTEARLKEMNPTHRVLRVPKGIS